MFWPILSLILIITSAVLIEVLYIKKERQKNNTKMSFKESLDLTRLLIVTFTCGKEKLNFMLDTGSDISYISNEYLSIIPHENINITSYTAGAGGANLETHHYKLKFQYKCQEFEDIFGALDLKESFDVIKNETGVTVHGILGTSFLDKYKYILDFKELIAYR